MKTLLCTLIIVAFFSSTASAGEAYGSYVDDPQENFDASSVRYETMTVQWKRVSNENLKHECSNEYVKRGYEPLQNNVNGCTFWDGTECLIITGTLTTMHTIGHEFRHCFQGAWH